MKRAPTLLLGLAALAAAPAARADYETWFWLETRTPIVRAPRPAFPRIDLRTFTDVRLNGRSGGLAQSFLRAGPLFFLTDFLFVGDEECGEHLAGLYSLVSTCEANGIDPIAYISDVLMRVDTHPASRIDELLPHRWAPRSAAA